MGQEQFAKGNHLAALKEMGIWKDVPFDAANFSTVGGGFTWTVASSGIVTNRYCRIGNLINWSVFITGTAGGTLGNTLSLVPPTPNKIARNNSCVGSCTNAAPPQLIGVRANPKNGALSASVTLGLFSGANFVAGSTTVIFNLVYEYGDSIY